ncbi:MAG: PQQ-binding-like beta-propeller repeat protein [Novosphingobium sp.]|nr:PQQ-binding-like beta-propeller repeat protein [Novosphingobium sp.]
MRGWLSMAALVMVAAMSMPAVSQDAPDSSKPGAALYAAQCAGCHGEYLQGGPFGPGMRGAGFASSWGFRRDELLDYVTKQMPPNAGRSLPAKDYATIVDHIFAVNETAAEDIPAELAVGPQPVGDEAFRGGNAYSQEMASQKALLSALSPVTPGMLRDPPDGDWLSWRRTLDSSGFSPLKQIDGANVAGLRLKWAWSVSHGRNEIAPIVHDGVMFINSGPVVEALDAASGTLLWRYARDIPPEFSGPLNMVQRSIAISGRTLLVPTPDRHLVALEVSSGEVVWDSEIIGDDKPRGVLSAGPVVAGDVIVQGTSISALTPGGSFVVGLDAKSGKQLWRFDSVARDNSWNGTPREERTGGAVWSAPSYDPETGLVYYGTGGSYDISRLLGPRQQGETSDALYTNATIALDPQTGEMRWHHQHMPREVWDLDEAFERTLVSVPVDGRERKLSVTIGKMGILDALDREDGRYAFSIDLGLNNIVTAIDPVTGARTVNPAKIPRPNEVIEICPSVQGARNWMATAWNPDSHTLYLPLENLCMDYVWSEPGGNFDSTVDNGWKLKSPSGSDGLNGHIQAIDLSTRKTRWVRRNRAVPSSSLLATGGGLIFAGHTNRTFQALDDASGEVLWQTRLASAPNATPVTFSAGGQQYVAIASGAGGDQSSQTEYVTPEQVPSAPATTIWVFGL